MTTFTINISDQTAAEIAEAAQKLGLSAEDLVRASVEEKLKRLKLTFDDATNRVLTKNAELYRRLA